MTLFNFLKFLTMYIVMQDLRHSTLYHAMRIGALALSSGRTCLRHPSNSTLISHEQYIRLSYFVCEWHSGGMLVGTHPFEALKTGSQKRWMYSTMWLRSSIRTSWGTCVRPLSPRRSLIFSSSVNGATGPLIKTLSYEHMPYGVFPVFTKCGSI